MTVLFGRIGDWQATISAAVVLYVLLAVGCGSRIVDNPDNKPPFGVVDSPKDDETVGRVVDVIGWALDDSAVSTVRISVDGRLQASTAPDLPRPDVTSSLPQYHSKADLPGWRAEIDLGESAGPHTIAVQIVDDQGATADLRSIQVRVIERN